MHKAVVVAVITRDGGGTYLVIVENGDGSMTTLGVGVVGAPQRSLVSWRDHGLATLITAYPARGTTTAYDAEGRPVAERSIEEPRPVYDVEPPIIGWR